MEYILKNLPSQAAIDSFNSILAEIIPTVDPITVSLTPESVFIDTDEVDTQLVYEMLCMFMAGRDSITSLPAP